MQINIRNVERFVLLICIKRWRFERKTFLQYLRNCNNVWKAERRRRWKNAFCPFVFVFFFLRCGKLFAGKRTTFLLTGEHVAEVLLEREIQIYGPNNRLLSNQMANGNAGANGLLMPAKCGIMERCIIPFEGHKAFHSPLHRKQLRWTVQINQGPTFMLHGNSLARKKRVDTIG